MYLKIIAKYSAMLEPVTNILQGVHIDIYAVQNHIENTLSILQKHRNEDAVQIFSNLFSECNKILEELNIELKTPRINLRQVYRSNYEVDSPENYFKISVFFPYLDSLIVSLNTRFSKDNSVAFLLFSLHPHVF